MINVAACLKCKHLQGHDKESGELHLWCTMATNGNIVASMPYPIGLYEGIPRGDGVMGTLRYHFTKDDRWKAFKPILDASKLDVMHDRFLIPKDCPYILEHVIA